MRARFVKPDTLLLSAIVIGAAAVRLWRLDLMEFKGDEATACRLALHALGYSEPGVGRFFPTAGLTSSVGIPNPPLFVYFVALPLAIARSPLAAATAVAAANIVAVWLTYVAGKRCFSHFVGIAAAALLALSPWGIVFSRKIWAQDLLPLCTTLFVLQLHALLVEKKPRAGCWLIVIAAVATQIHFSAWILVPVAGAALLIGRQWIAWRWIAFAVAVSALLYAPFLVYHAGDIVNSVSHGAHGAPGIARRFELSARYMLELVGGGGMTFLLGKSSAFGTALSLLLGTGAFGGILLATRRRSPPLGRLGAVFVLWCALPITALTLLHTQPYLHYFIVLLPLPYFGLAHLIERASARAPAIRTAAVAACLVGFMVIDVRFFRTVIHDGGAPGDYGIAYRYQQEAVTALLRRNSGQRLRIGTDSTSTNILPAVRFLIWNAHPDRQTPRTAGKDRYVLVSTLGGSGRRQISGTGADRLMRFGPLVVLTVPNSHP